MNDELNHVLTQVLCVPEESVLYLAIKALNLDDPDDLLYIDRDTDLKYELQFANDTDSTNVTYTYEQVSISELHKSKLIQLCDYYRYEKTKDPDTTVEWTQLTSEGFKTFKRQSMLNGTPKTVRYENTTTPLTYPMTPISSGNPTINTPTSQQTDLTVNNNNNFRSTIKFTTKDYPTLSNDKDWRTYQRLLKAAANNHQTSEILASDKPNDPTDPNYLQKQSFMYNMFATNITTAKGQLCIRKHEEDMDAQKVYQELLKAYADDLSANLAASTLREHLTLLKFDDKWKGTYENFLNNWTTKII
ncbi:MAG TPA: hypothetical protein VLS94_11885, partial [Fusibacter sp.]|nr:hypothetical protein [Fusibacter sp.]